MSAAEVWGRHANIRNDKPKPVRATFSGSSRPGLSGGRSEVVEASPGSTRSGSGEERPTDFGGTREKTCDKGERILEVSPSYIPSR